MSCLTKSHSPQLVAVIVCSSPNSQSGSATCTTSATPIGVITFNWRSRIFSCKNSPNHPWMLGPPLPPATRMFSKLKPSLVSSFVDDFFSTKRPNQWLEFLLVSLKQSHTREQDTPVKLSSGRKRVSLFAHSQSSCKMVLSRCSHILQVSHWCPRETPSESGYSQGTQMRKRSHPTNRCFFSILQRFDTLRNSNCARRRLGVNVLIVSSKSSHCVDTKICSKRLVIQDNRHSVLQIHTQIFQNTEMRGAASLHGEKQTLGRDAFLVQTRLTLTAELMVTMCSPWENHNSCLMCSGQWWGLRTR